MTAEERAESVRKRLQIPREGVLPCVFDSDTCNEIDDQFALAYLLRHDDRFDVQALYAEPFSNEREANVERGMEKSYDEIFKVLELMKIPPKENFVFAGSRRYIGDRNNPEKSPAAADLIERAKRFSPENPLYVIATGCITNIANALIIAPEIKDNIVIVWLGGHAVDYPLNPEFNLKQDLVASREVLSCGTALVHVACIGCTSHLCTTIFELEHYMAGRNDICDYLLYITRDYLAGKTYQRYHFGKSKVLWDLGPIAYLVNPDWFDSKLIKAPHLADDCTWAIGDSDHEILTLTYCRRDRVFCDFFRRVVK